ncbi:hypothetical protein [Clostridium argentinense]|uniref:hypothetical protein n=1 Tax=Clostridium argentinense TaxID=29341 RepID=UPI0030014114
MSKWLEYSEEDSVKDAEEKMSYVIEAIKAVRNIRTEMKIPLSRKAKLIVFTSVDFSVATEKFRID